MRLNTAIAYATVSGVLAIGGTATADVVFSNNGGFGDAFTNASSTNTGQAVVGSNWYYNNVRNNGTVGINSTYARNGNGSVYFNAAQGPGGASSKADIEFFGSASANGAGNYGPTSGLGTLGSLNALSYDWYRDSSSGASQWLHPVIRLMVVDPDTLQAGYLVFEREVNNADFGGPGAAAPTDQWVSEDVFGGNYRMWSTGSLPNTALYYNALHLGDWMANYGHYVVTGVSLGVGSGWGTFTGAVDNVSFGFEGGESYDFNFEVIPAPGALALLGMASLTAGGRRRRN